MYGICAALVITFTFLPIKKITPISERSDYRILTATLLVECCLTMIVGNTFSPLYSLEALADEYRNKQDLTISIEGQPDMTGKFYKSGIDSYTDIIATEYNKPNVVLIFTEGLSQNIIDDERNIMPNTKAFQERSIIFTNYYNHTSATYRGIIGQLYSGHQLNNLDANSLVSLQSILKDQGYNTTFINTEPKNKEFTRYLNSMGFDDIVADNVLDGQLNSITDKHAFQLLYETMQTMSEAKDGETQPFLVAMYTFGTHNTFDSPDEIFEEGTDRVLNKFYNLDYQFGSFLDVFNLR